MLPRDWFSVGLRLFGVYVVYRGFSFLLTIFADKLDVLSKSEISQELGTYPAHSGYSLVMSLGLMGFGFVLIYGAERITRWTFNEPSPYADEDVPSQPE